MNPLEWQDWTLDKGRLYYDKGLIHIDVGMIARAHPKMKVDKKYSKKLYVESLLDVLHNVDTGRQDGILAKKVFDHVQEQLPEPYRDWYLKYFFNRLEKKE